MSGTGNYKFMQLPLDQHQFSLGKNALSFYLHYSGVNGHCTYGWSYRNAIKLDTFFYVSVLEFQLMSAATHSDPICANIYNGDLGNWLDFQVHYSYLSSPTKLKFFMEVFSLLHFVIPQFTKNVNMGDSLLITLT